MDPFGYLNHYQEFLDNKKGLLVIDLGINSQIIIFLNSLFDTGADYRKQ
jgi:hypothetical protein